MTVAELIEHLKQFPGHLPVIQTLCSDYSPLEAGDVTRRTVSFRAGEYRTYYPCEQYPPGEEPVYVDVVHFAGN